MIESKLVETALKKLKRGNTPGNVAAVLAGESGPRDLDGVRWSFVVTDGSHTDVIEVGLSGSQGGGRGMSIDQDLLEGAVERRAVCSFPVESRLPDLVAASPLSLRREDLR
jgi:hypothetical protein